MARHQEVTERIAQGLYCTFLAIGHFVKATHIQIDAARLAAQQAKKPPAPLLCEVRFQLRLILISPKSPSFFSD